MTDARAHVREIFGEVSPAWEALLRKDPGFAKSFADWLHAAYHTDVLEPHIRELLLLAHDVSVTVLDADATRLRVCRARDAGATERQVLDILELVSMLTIHSLTTGLPIVHGGAPQPPATRGGYWDAFEVRFPGYHGAMAELMPAAFDAYRGLGQALWREAGLAPKWRELAFVVADLSTTHLFGDGAALHIANALHYGASREEVVAAIGLTVTTAARTIELGMAALMEYEGNLEED